MLLKNVSSSKKIIHFHFSLGHFKQLHLEKGWVKILSGAANEVQLKLALLQAQEINAVIINKQDSSYLFGEAELYVPQDEVIRAKRILDEENA